MVVVLFTLSGYSYLGDGGADRHEILHDGRLHIGAGQIFSPLRGGTPGIPKCEILGLNFGHLTANVSRTASRSVTCQLELNISSTRAL